MSTRINPLWQEKIRQQVRDGEKINVTVKWNPAAQWLIEYLADNGILFKCKNIGAGVKYITTETEKCPLCGGKVK